MEIYSFDSEIWSKATSDRVRVLIAQAQGPIVMPISAEAVRYCRMEARKPKVVQFLKGSTIGLYPPLSPS